MYAYILNNTIDFVSQSKDENIDSIYQVIPYSIDIKNPKFSGGIIIDEETENDKKTRIYNELLKKTPEEINKIDNAFFEGVNFTDDELEYISHKYVYPKGSDFVLTEFLTRIASGNFSAGQELGEEIANRKNAIEYVKQAQNKKHFIIEPEIEVTLDL